MAKYRKLGKTSSQRKALLRNQVTQLIYHGKITTTEARSVSLVPSLLALSLNPQKCSKELETSNNSKTMQGVNLLLYF